MQSQPNPLNSRNKIIQKLSDFFINDNLKHSKFIESFPIHSEQYLNDFLDFINILNQQEDLEYTINNMSDYFSDLPDYPEMFDKFLDIYSEWKAKESKYETYKYILSKYQTKTQVHSLQISYALSWKELYDKLWDTIQASNMSFEDFLTSFANIVWTETILDNHKTTANRIFEGMNDEDVVFDEKDKESCMKNIIKPFLLSNIGILQLLLEYINDPWSGKEVLDSKWIYNKVINKINRIEWWQKLETNIENPFSRPLWSQEEFDKSKIELFLFLGDFIWINKIKFIDDIKTKTKNINNLKIQYDTEYWKILNIKDFMLLQIQKLRDDYLEDWTWDLEAFVNERKRMLKNTFDNLSDFYKIDIYISILHKHDFPIFTFQLNRYIKKYDPKGKYLREDIKPIIVLPSFYIDDKDTDDYENILLKIMDALSKNYDILQWIWYNDEIIWSSDDEYDGFDEYGY